MTHLTPDEFIDAVERTLTPGRLAHLETCARCKAEVAQLTSTLHELRSIDVPEPSPLFWDRFSERVQALIVETPGGRPQRRWFEWPVLAPLGGLALLVAALSLSISPSPLRAPAEDSGAAQLTAATEADALDADDTWAMVVAMVGDLDVDDAAEAGLLGRPGSADDVVLQLTAAEREELVRLLREELRPGG